MTTIPEIGFLRLSQIIGNKKSNPKIPPLIPVCKSTWWGGIKSGRFPKPIKLGTRITVWRAEDIRHLIEHGGDFINRDELPFDHVAPKD